MQLTRRKLNNNFCFQVAPETPAIFALLYELFRSEPVDVLRKRATQELGWSEAEFQALLVYVAGFYDNGGNYKSFGDAKFIPDVEPGKLRALLEKSKAFAKNPDLLGIYDRIEDRLFSLDEKHLLLGYPDKVG